MVRPAFVIAVIVMVASSGANAQSFETQLPEAALR
jgi:hypothetical protein